MVVSALTRKHIVGIVVVAIVLLAIWAVMGGFLVSHPSLSTSTITVGSTATANSAIPVAKNTSSSGSTAPTITQSSNYNMTLTVPQVEGAINGSWQKTFDSGFHPSAGSVPIPGNIIGTGMAIFASPSLEITDMWYEYRNQSIILRTPPFNNSVFAANVSAGAHYSYSHTYITLNQSMMVAYEGNYTVLIYSRNGTFTLNQGKELLASQMKDLGLN